MDAELSQALLEAARDGDVEPFVHFFENHNAEELLLIRNEYSQATPLHNAAANDHAELLTIMLGHMRDADILEKAISVRNDAGNTPLLWAVMTGAVESVRILLDAGSDPLIRNAAGLDAIAQAVLVGNEAVVDYLYSRVEAPRGNADDTDNAAEAEAAIDL